MNVSICLRIQPLNIHPITMPIALLIRSSRGKYKIQRSSAFAAGLE